MEQKLQKLSQKCNVTVLRNAIEISPSMAMSSSDQEEDNEGMGGDNKAKEENKTDD